MKFGAVLLKITVIFATLKRHYVRRNKSAFAKSFGGCGKKTLFSLRHGALPDGFCPRGNCRVNLGKFMRLLKEIYFGEKPTDISSWDRRKSARAVVFDKENNVGILYVHSYEFPKLPGGEVEKGESLEQALCRECLEEIGCEIEIIGEVGEVIEYREEKRCCKTLLLF